MFSPNGHFIAAASSDGRLSLWDWKYNTLILEEKDLALNSQTGYGIAFSPDSKRSFRNYKHLLLDWFLEQ